LCQQGRHDRRADRAHRHRRFGRRSGNGRLRDGARSTDGEDCARRVGWRDARLSGKLDVAIKNFTDAAALEHELPYTEPPYWHQPVSQLLGAALLQAGRAPEAEAVYRKSLMTYRLDGWALFGLAQAQDAQGHHDEANATRKEFDRVWQLADVKLASSRF